MMVRLQRLMAMIACLILLTGGAFAQQPKGKGKAQAPAYKPTYPDLVYGTVGGQPIKLDLYLPKDLGKPVPVVVRIHGGGWRGGDKKSFIHYNGWLVELGFAVASVQYRLTGQEAMWGGAPVIFPAQIQDVKGAVRWLRANAAKYHLDPNRFGAWGESAGGHLTALLATSGGVKELEGETGGNLECSSRVQVGVDYYGPTDFLKTTDDITTPPGCVLRHDIPDSFFGHLFGFDAPDQGLGVLTRHPEDNRPLYERVRHLCEMCNPITHVTPDDPPLFIGHGTNDLLVPIKQSQRLEDALKKAGVKVKLEMPVGAPHGDLGLETNRDALLFVCDALKPEAKAKAAKFDNKMPKAAAPAAGPAKAVKKKGGKKR